MKRIEKIKGMDAARLAEFLVEQGAEVPAEFCDCLCFGQSCAGCPYTGEDGGRRAWKEWLESEYDREEKEDGQESQEPEELQTDEQNTPEQERSTKENDEQDDERDAGSGPADRRKL